MDIGPCIDCECCKSCADKQFQKVIEFKEAGLVIYRYAGSPITPGSPNTADKGTNLTEDIFIVHNKNNLEVKNNDIYKAFDQYKPKCPRCRQIVEHFHKLIQKIPNIDKNNIIGICNHCKLREDAKKYCECETVLKKFISTKHPEKVTLTNKTKEWLTKIQDTIKTVIYDEEKQRFHVRIKPDQAHSETDLTKPQDTMKYKKEPNIELLRFSDIHRPESKDRFFLSKESKRKVRRPSSDQDLLATISNLPTHIRSDVGFQYYFPKKPKIIEKTVDVSSTELLKATKEKVKLKLIEDKRKQQEEADRKKASKYADRDSKDRALTKKERDMLKKSKESETDGDLKDKKRKSPKDGKGEDDDQDEDDEKKGKKGTDKDGKRKSVDSKKGDKEGKYKADGSDKQSKGPEDKLKRDDKIKHTDKISEDKKGGVRDKDETMAKDKGKGDMKDKDGGKDKDLGKDNATGKGGQKDDKTKREGFDKDRGDDTLKDGKTKDDITKGDKIKDDKGRDDKTKDDKTRDDKIRDDKTKDDKTRDDKTRDAKTKDDKTKDDKTKDDKSKLGSDNKTQDKDKGAGKDKGVGKDKAPGKDKGKEGDLIGQAAQKGDKTKGDGGGKEKAVEKPDKKTDVSALANAKMNQMLTQQAKLKEENSKIARQIEEQERKAREIAEKKAQEAAAAMNLGSELSLNKKLDIKHIRETKLDTEDDNKLLTKGKFKGKPKRLSDINLTNHQVAEHNRCHKNRKLATCILCNDSNIELDVESIRRRANKKEEVEDIIIGTKLYKYKPLLNKKSKEERTQAMVITESTTQLSHGITNFIATDMSSDTNVTEQEGRGIIRYALSDRTFIDKGWTMLPTEKVVRKMNVYRMQPARPEFDWFEHNKHKGMMQYDSGERLATFDDDGRGRWYYRNGRVALDYYDAEELNAQQRFVVYSNGLPDERGRSRPITVLATFDYLGNGVVFDHTGKVRLKYNQTEGVMLDRSLGPPSHWKWHTLNDPPVLQQVMIDTFLPHKDPQITKLGGPVEEIFRPDNEEMLAIEFDNFVKEKSKKLTQKFKPFQIKMKALKINENFSLRINNQASVYLIYRDGSNNLKLNLGMILNHQEIIDTDTAEVSEVSNTLERLPARTNSLAALQNTVAHAQRMERARTEREWRLKRPEPNSSVDKLVMGLSKPLRPPLAQRSPFTSTTGSEIQCKCRKPPTNNLYRNTRLI